MQGNVGLGKAIAHFTQKGYVISIPLNDSQDYDLIVEYEGNLHKVQVKTVYAKSTSGFYRVELRTRTSRGTDKNFGDSNSEFLFILTDCGDSYLIPVAEIVAKTALTLNADCHKYKV